MSSHGILNIPYKFEGDSKSVDIQFYRIGDQTLDMCVKKLSVYTYIPSILLNMNKNDTEFKFELKYIIGIKNNKNDDVDYAKICREILKFYGEDIRYIFAKYIINDIYSIYDKKNIIYKKYLFDNTKNRYNMFIHLKNTT